jgi:predicted NBD/HSP70 family sugar kinase
MSGHAQNVQVALADLKGEQDVRRRSVSAQSTWKKSTASMLVAWVRRNCRQLVSVRRIGAGGMRCRFRIRRIVEAPTRWPSLSSSPWIRV